MCVYIYIFKIFVILQRTANKKGLFRILKENEISESRQTTDLTIFDLRTISAATDNFNPANKLGEGGFGAVYKVVNNRLELDGSKQYLLSDSD